MSIDMKSYAGEVEAPATVEQTQVLNSYQQEAMEEFPMPEMPESSAPVNETPVLQKEAEPPAPTAQELNFRALTDTVEKLKAERETDRREYQLQLDMLRANGRQQAEAPKQKKMFDGMEDADIPNVGELRRAWNEREVAYQEKIEELQVASQHPDYAEVLGKNGKHLAETDPIFLQGIRGAENKALFAYQYAKQHQELQELRAMKNSASTQQQQSAVAQKIVENARKPGNLAQTGGQSVLSKADYYATMSDQDFMKLASKHLERI